MHETAIDGDRNIERDFFCLLQCGAIQISHSNVQTVRTNYLETQRQFLAHVAMQTIPAANTRIWGLSIISF